MSTEVWEENTLLSVSTPENPDFELWHSTWVFDLDDAVQLQSVIKHRTVIQICKGIHCIWMNVFALFLLVCLTSLPGT